MPMTLPAEFLTVNDSLTPIPPPSPKSTLARICPFLFPKDTSRHLHSDQRTIRPRPSLNKEVNSGALGKTCKLCLNRNHDQQLNQRESFAKPVSSLPHRHTPSEWKTEQVVPKIRSG